MKPALPSPAPVLTAAEARILADFRAMDLRSKSEMCTEMDRRARAYPARRPATLRLVSGGAQ